jgi:hypothetical protein
MDARDRLSLVLVQLRRRTGTRVSDRRFTIDGPAKLATQISDLRAELRAFDGQLCRIEAQARAEAGIPAQLPLDTEVA